MRGWRAAGRYRLKVGILTPSYAPAPGGAANYYSLLAEKLARDPAIDSLEVVTERYPGQSLCSTACDGSLIVRRCFNYRAGRAVRDWRSYLDYANQCVSLSRVGNLFRSDLDVLLVHAQFHYNPTLLNRGIRALRRTRNKRIRLILDVRDPLMSPNKRSNADLYDDVICCSRNTLHHMKRVVGTSRPTHLIPIPFEPPQIDGNRESEVCQKYGLENQEFLLATNGMQRSKGVDLCLEVTRILQELWPGITLVVAGRRRDWSPEYETAQRRGLLKYIGMVPNRELLTLAAKSKLHINPSPIEGLPRASLEAIAVGAPVLLPPNVPEFEESVPELIAHSMNPKQLASQVAKILERRETAKAYPVDRHYFYNVLREYIDLFYGVRAPD